MVFSSVVNHVFSTGPKIVEFKPQHSFNLGQKFKLFCYLNEGSKPINFEWFKNDKLIKPNSHYRIDTSEDESHLTIDRLSKNDNGNYSCSAKSQFGFDKHSTQLIVKGFGDLTIILGYNFIRHFIIYYFV